LQEIKDTQVELAIETIGNTVYEYTITMMSMKSIIVLCMALVAAVDAFTTVSTTRSTFGITTTSQTTTSLNGLFDFLSPKPSSSSSSGPAKKGPKMDQSVFGGSGKKITIRQDEDNAMWFDEPKDNKKKKGGK
jgi:hypothetical protein